VRDEKQKQIPCGDDRKKSNSNGDGDFFMGSMECLQRIHEISLIPVLRASSPEQALTIAEAILAGGVSVLEVTMTVPGAIAVMEKLAAKHGDKLLLGAGTVLDAETARACLLAGAQFVVSPLPQIRVVPTGGVSLATAEEFLEAGAYALGVGSDLVDAQAAAAGKPEIIMENAKQYMAIVRKMRPART
jgi:2-dehydro-3-deoxyphosphogluconate aldolase/(4S)-4-hydroxy-2-oxoglutarate aldolase